MVKRKQSTPQRNLQALQHTSNSPSFENVTALANNVAANKAKSRRGIRLKPFVFELTGGESNTPLYMIGSRSIPYCSLSSLKQQLTDDSGVGLFLERRDNGWPLSLAACHNEYRVELEDAEKSLGATNAQLLVLKKLVELKRVHIEARVSDNGSNGSIICDFYLTNLFVMSKERADNRKKKQFNRQEKPLVTPASIFLNWFFNEHGLIDDTYSVVRGNDTEKEQENQFNASELFERIKPDKDAQELKDSEIPCPRLCTAELRPYQRQAVKWMLERETSSKEELDHAEESFWFKWNATLKLLSETEPESRTVTLYINKFSGQVFTEDIWKNRDGRFIRMHKGGILAEEMGLGKTVEMISLILLNRNTSNNWKTIKMATEEDKKTNEAEDGSKIEVNCICGVNIPTIEGGLIQCKSCMSWQHKLCACIENDRPLVYYCLDCLCSQENEDKSEVNATLIICPAPIMAQWKSEIERHTVPGSLRLLIYQGVKQAKIELASLIRTRRSKSEIENIAHQFWPHHLGGYDIILTTYDVLRKDIDHVSSSTRKMGDKRFFLRHKRRYTSFPSPLTHMKWWRICLDEAQQVESSATKAAAMALKLSAKYKWCVTGTPVGAHGLEDLYGLLLFLEREPFNVRSWWKHTVEGRSNFERLVKLFKNLLWRHTKLHVSDQLKLPSKTEHVYALEFSAVERHFYIKQHEQTQRIALSEGHSDNIFTSLLRLRQCCCHPQVGSFGIKRGHKRKGKRARTDKQKGLSVNVPMTLREIHEQLVVKAKTECEEAQRLFVLNLNGLAALQMAVSETESAEATYRKALGIMEENEKNGLFKSDSLQRLHAMEGLCTILENVSASGSLTRSLHVEKLRRSCTEIRDKYMKRWETEVISSMNQFQSVEKLTQSYLQEEFSMLSFWSKKKDDDLICTWWIYALSILPEESKALLINRLHSGAQGVKNTNDSLVREFRDVTGLQLILHRELGKIGDCRDDVKDMLKRITLKPTVRQVQESANCSVCRSYFKKTGPMCEHCKEERILVSYETVLFSFRESRGSRQQQLHEMDVFRDGNVNQNGDLNSNQFEDVREGVGYAYREPCQVHAILKVVKSSLKAIPNCPRELIKASDAFFSAFDNMCKEMYAARSVWRHKEYQLKALDELEMATLRLRLQLPGEKVEEDEKIWKVHPQEVPVRRQELESDCAQANFSLEKAKSQLRYLKTIDLEHEPTTNSNQPSIERAICLICHDSLTSHERLAVLDCGHSFCAPCIDKLSAVQKRRGMTKVMCPTCRQRSDTVKIAITSVKPGISDEKKVLENDHNISAHTEKREGNENRSVKVKGSFGSKIEGVVRTLLKLEMDDPTMKAVIFSQWNDVLLILEHALHMNDVSFVRMQTASKFDLTVFREDPAIKCLLLPVIRGNNGLNLTEANHVMFLEPLLNPAVDLQAVSRVHRMSQTRDVHVHRFIIKNTVEEKIFALMKNKTILLTGESSKEVAKVSAEDLKEIFDI